MEYRQQPSFRPEDQIKLVKIEGVKLRLAHVLGDDRGTIQEVIDVRDEYCNDAFVYLYKGTCRPGKYKGWGIHDYHVDRYIVIDGEMLLVLYFKYKYITL